VKITRADANKAINLIKGIVDHPSWAGIDRDALGRVMDALASRRIEIEEPLPNIAIPGDKVIFDCHGGNEIEHANAQRYLDLGGVYEVARIKVGRSSTEYYIQGASGHGVNSVLFSFADPDAVRNETDEQRAERNRIVQENFDFNYPRLRDYQNNLKDDTTI